MFKNIYSVVFAIYTNCENEEKELLKKHINIKEEFNVNVQNENFTIRSLKETFIHKYGKKYSFCPCVLSIYKNESGKFVSLDNKDEETKINENNNTKLYIIKKSDSKCNCQINHYIDLYHKNIFLLFTKLQKLEDENIKLNKEKLDLDKKNKELENEINKIIKKDEENIKKAEEFYDVIVDIKSIKGIKEGWKIKMNRKGEELYLKCKHNKCLKIGVIGNKNKGKSFLLSKISNTKLLSGSHIETEGISIKYHDSKYKSLILLDSAGLETPVFKNKFKKK